MKRLAQKALAAETRNLAGVDRVVLPLGQAHGAALEVTVKQGQTVARGEAVAGAPGGGGLALHSPLAGEVSRVFQTMDENGESVPAIEIRGDAAASLQTLEPLTADVGSLSAEALRTRLLEAGVCPLGGNGRNGRYATLAQGESSPAVLVVLCADEEPLIHTQDQMLTDMAAEVVEGATLYQKAIGAGRLVFAVTADRQDLVSGETLTLPRNYPSALPELVLAQATGSYGLSGPWPRSDVHLINAETAVAASRAVREGAPVVEKVLTVGLDGGQPALFRVPLGASLSAVLEEVGLGADEGDRVFCGGPLRGRAQFDLDRSVTKGTDSLLVQKGGQVFLYEDAACIGCGACVRACPMKIQVDMMTRNCEYGRIDEAVRYDLESCVECGLCAYVCTARRPLLQYILFAKVEKKKSEGNEA